MRAHGAPAPGSACGDPLVILSREVWWNLVTLVEEARAGGVASEIAELAQHDEALRTRVGELLATVEDQATSMAFLHAQASAYAQERNEAEVRAELAEGRRDAEHSMRGVTHDVMLDERARANRAEDALRWLIESATEHDLLYNAWAAAAVYVCKAVLDGHPVHGPASREGGQ